MPGQGWDSVTVPGAVSAWMELHAKFGKLPFDHLFEPAIRYARDGFLVPPAIAGMWNAQAPTLEHFPTYKVTFMPNGRAPMTGERFRCLDQAATLEAIAASKATEASGRLKSSPPLPWGLSRKSPTVAPKGRVRMKAAQKRAGREMRVA